MDAFRSQYLDFLLRNETYRGEYIPSSRGITTSRLRLYPDDFLRIWFVRPPLDEQDSILCWIERETAELNRAMGAANREIALLHEYRTRLIADVVTGKLDARAAAASLPEYIEEQQLLDDAEEIEPDEGGADEGGEAEIEEAAA
jgi:type I restriction enzyme, S subunit